MTDGGPLTFSIHEITVAVHDIPAASRLFGQALQGDIDPIQSFPHPRIEAEMGGVSLGDFHLALVTDQSGSGPIGRFLSARGEGMYEVNVRTNDLDAAMAHVRSLGLQFINEEPIVLEHYVTGDGTRLSELRLAFVDPSRTHGVLIELAEWVE